MTDIDNEPAKWWLLDKAGQWHASVDGAALCKRTDVWPSIGGENGELCVACMAEILRPSPQGDGDPGLEDRP